MPNGGQGPPLAKSWEESMMTFSDRGWPDWKVKTMAITDAAGLK
jgi:hypothetical protein